MKRTALAFAALALSGAAEAVTLAPNGLGQALLYPYYTVNGGNQTVFTVVNTRDEVKALRVRFVEARNGRETLSFNLYLAPFDTWAGALFDTAANGGAGLVTQDRSCTVPNIVGNSSLPQVGTNRFVPLLNFGYTDVNDDGGGASLGRTREGRFEIIEMGVVRAGSGAGQLGDEATQGSNGVPANCPALSMAWNIGGAWAAGPSADVTAPTGGLFGTAAIVDVANGTLVEYRADAIDAFYATGDSADDLHFAPGALRPTLDDARSGGKTPPVSSAVPAGTSIVASTWARGVDAVSAVLMADSIVNEYSVSDALGATTEWVVSFPTKRYYVDATEFGGVATLSPSDDPAFRLALPPFSGFGFTRSGSPRSGGFACETIEFEVHDRDQLVSVNPGTSANAEALALCEETNVVSFSNGADTIFGSPRVLVVDQPFESGWARLSFVENDDTTDSPGMTSSDGDAYGGLPVSGFAAYNVVNAAAAPGVLANYAGSQPHRMVKDAQ